jgi:hypothetical protein
MRVAQLFHVQLIESRLRKGLSAWHARTLARTAEGTTCASSHIHYALAQQNVTAPRHVSTRRIGHVTVQFPGCIPSLTLLTSACISDCLLIRCRDQSTRSSSHPQHGSADSWQTNAVRQQRHRFSRTACKHHGPNTQQRYDHITTSWPHGTNGQSATQQACGKHSGAS